MDLRPPRWNDALVAAGLLILGVLWAVSLDSAELLSASRDMDLWGYLLLIGQVIPLIWRQRFPRAVLWLTGSVWVVTVGLGYESGPAMLAVFVAIYGVGAYLPRWTAIRHGAVLLGVMMTWTAAGLATYDNIPWSALVAVPLGVLIPLALGIADRRRRQRITELEVANVRREQAGFEAATDAVRAERARIARELHDVVAHEITVMTLQAEGARRTLGERDPEIREALATIAASGRTGLEEMQRMIGVLRASEQEANERADADRALAAGTAPPRASVLDGLSPMPSLAALPTLVRHVQESGLPVTLEISGSAHVPAGVEVSAYRIVQEALTNALKHAGSGARAEVTVKRTADAVRITVVDDGRGATSETVRLPGGHGLTGMAERVQALGGSLSHGSRRGGGFEVHAVLPSGDDQIRGDRPATAEGVTA
ncbi:sensor histidine kinase [Demequina activiva]|uniref:histidine kinase n=1 Tax=Demequina activiva TaxID=1582364 RepID=A0A919Q3D4_9MICO|nr:sensor histidine kinase [Demequina activiva]GIG54854.1 two-component sensor histidine kinase [Demequina activiva]